MMIEAGPNRGRGLADIAERRTHSRQADSLLINTPQLPINGRVARAVAEGATIARRGTTRSFGESAQHRERCSTTPANSAERESEADRREGIQNGGDGEIYHVVRCALDRL